MEIDPVIVTLSCVPGSFFCINFNCWLCSIDRFTRKIGQPDNQTLFLNKTKYTTIIFSGYHSMIVPFCQISNIQPFGKALAV